MNYTSRKGHSNWLGATALAGSLGILLFSFSLNQPVMAQSVYLSAGGGGGGTQNGTGGNGAGGLATSEKPELPNRGGKGSGDAGGLGGIGGASDINGKNTFTADEGNVLGIEIVPPIHGIDDSKNTGKGGKGGNINANLTKDITVESIILEAGDGGEPGKIQEGATGVVGIGGQGGSTRLDGNGYTVTFNNTLDLTSGRAGGKDSQKSEGGDVGFSAKNIIVGEDKKTTINLMRNDGKLLFKTESLDARKGNVTINLDNTQAWTNNNDDGVTFGDLLIGMGRQVAINGNGEYSISSITVGELGNTDLTPAKFSTETDLKLDSHSVLTFYLPENINNGSSLLRITGDGNVAINNAAVELKLAGADLKNLKPGDQIRLIEGQVVGNSSTTEQIISYGAKNWNFGIATTTEKNLVASLKGPKVPAANPDTNDDNTNNGTNAGDNTNKGDGNDNGNNTGTGSNAGDGNTTESTNGSDNNNSNNGDKNNNSTNSGNHSGLTGEDDGNGNIYQDDYGAVTINRAKANAYFQSNAAALNALNYGADQIATIDDYVLPMDVKKINEPVEGVVFMQGSGFKQEVETGSHIKNNGYHLMGGGGVRYHQDHGNLLATVFIEHGDGDYDTYHQKIHGEGDFSYTGGGLYAKQTWDDGWFLDGSGRAGRVKRDFNSSSMENGGFDDKSSNYYGFHIGGGKELEISTDNKLTLNGRLLWTEIEDFSVKTKADEHLGFDSARSVRTHLGARVDHQVTPEAKLYAGAAWEQELDGEISGKLDSYHVDKPDFSGASAVFEVGGKYEQIPGMQGWIANAGLKGVAGKRDEFSGKVGLGYRW